MKRTIIAILAVCTLTILVSSFTSCSGWNIAVKPDEQGSTAETGTSVVGQGSALQVMDENAPVGGTFYAALTPNQQQGLLKELSMFSGAVTARAVIMPDGYEFPETIDAQCCTLTAAPEMDDRYFVFIYTGDSSIKIVYELQNDRWEMIRYTLPGQEDTTPQRGFNVPFGTAETEKNLESGMKYGDWVLEKLEVNPDMLTVNLYAELTGGVELTGIIIVGDEEKPIFIPDYESYCRIPLPGGAEFRVDLFPDSEGNFTILGWGFPLEGYTKAQLEREFGKANTPWALNGVTTAFLQYSDCRVRVDQLSICAGSYTKKTDPEYRVIQSSILSAEN